MMDNTHPCIRFLLICFTLFMKTASLYIHLCTIFIFFVLLLSRMSHAVTITRTTTTTTSTSALILNTGYLKTLPGILKLTQLVSFLKSKCKFKNKLILNSFQILGGLCVFFVGWNFWRYSNSFSELFFLCMASTFFIGTFCLLASCLVSLSTGGIISRTIYELVYHSIAFLLYLIAGILLLVKATDYRREASHPHMIASVRFHFHF